MTKPLYVSYFTPDNGYAEEARQLLETLNTLQLEHCVRPVKNIGGWHENTQQKPRYIRQMMQEFPGRSIVWLDADARVKSTPFLFAHLDCDFAAHWKDGEELLSSTLYFAPTTAASACLDEWEAENVLRPDGINGDQMNLQIVVDRMAREKRLRTYRLPPGYALIFDLMRGQGIATILQTQASRRLRK